MKPIKIEEWGTFPIGELFDIHPTKAYKLTNSSLMEENGVNPVVVNSSFNNGIGGYTNQENTEKGGIITFSDTTSADAIFFQETDFVGYPHVQGMYPIGEYKNKWTKYSLLFFVSVFRNRALGLNYDYVNKFTRESAKQIIIKLPVDETGKPNFSYMESYMKNLELAVSSSLTDLQSAKKSNILGKLTLNNWKSFRIIDLFTIKNTHSILKSALVEDSGKIPYVTASNENNGVYSYVDYYDHLKEKGNCIMIGGKTLTITYQKSDFFSNDSHNLALYLKDSVHRTEEIHLFMITALRASIGHSYSWGNSISFKSIQKDYVNLPIDNKGNPDYKYMTEYINKIKEKTLCNLAVLQAV